MQQQPLMNCPHCKHRIPKGAHKCPICHEHLGLRGRLRLAAAVLMLIVVPTFALVISCRSLGLAEQSAATAQADRQGRLAAEARTRVAQDNDLAAQAAMRVAEEGERVAQNSELAAQAAESVALEEAATASVALQSQQTAAFAVVRGVASAGGDLRESARLQLSPEFQFLLRGDLELANNVFQQEVQEDPTNLDALKGIIYVDALRASE